MQSTLVGSKRVLFFVVLYLLLLFEMFFVVVLLLMLRYLLGSFKDWIKHNVKRDGKIEKPLRFVFSYLVSCCCPCGSSFCRYCRNCLG